MKNLLTILVILFVVSINLFADGDTPGSGYKDCTDPQVGCIACPDITIQCDPNYPPSDPPLGDLNAIRPDDGTESFTFSTIMETTVERVGAVLFALY